MQRSSKLLFVTLGRGLALCFLALMAMLGQTQAAGRNITFTTNGVTTYGTWFDVTDPANSVFGQIQLFTSGSAAQPSYQLFYYVFSNVLFNSGFGPIPAASVKLTGGSVASGKMVVNLNVDTCQLDPSVFSTFSGSCGVINGTWAEVPGRNPTGVTVTTNGTTDTISGTITQHISGTTQYASAIAQGNVIGSVLAPAPSVASTANIGLARTVNVIIYAP
jgi:hypothetical protein